MTKVSVILPVYGVAQYIKKCTESLLAQTLDDMEFIFVDDHGPDDSIAIAKQTIAGHPRESQFRFLKPEHNLGAGMARNYAISQAKGEYIAFVDSDDWIESEMFAELYKEAKAHGDADLCYCQAFKDFSDGSESEVLKNPHVASGEFSHDNKAFFLVNYVSLFWTFIYKRELVERNVIRFPEERSADDSYFVSCSLMMAQSIASVDKPYYHYLIRSGSVCTTKDSAKYKKRLIVFDKLLQYAKEHQVYEELKEEIDFMYIKKGGLSSMTNYIINSTHPNPAIYKEIYAELVKQVPDYKLNRYYCDSKSIQLLLRMSQHTPAVFTKLIRIWAKKKNVVG